MLIDSLPSTIEPPHNDHHFSTSLMSTSGGSGNVGEHYATSIRRLEHENVETEAQLEETIKRSELMLERIQIALAEIAQLQLKSQSLNEC